MEAKNKGQVTIFIILGLIIIVGVVVIVYFISRNRPSTDTLDVGDPAGYISTCTRVALRDSLDVLLPQGGVYNPKDYKLYRDTKVAYLCKNVNFYQPCINQYPRYITFVKGEIERATESKVTACFDALEEDLRSKGYDVLADEGMNYTIQIKPGIVSATINKKFIVTKGETVRDFSTFSTLLTSPVYDLSSVVTEIISQEARFCNFETLGFSLLYPAYDISRYTLSDSTKIYTIVHVETKKKMNIAIRGCAIPAGF